MRVRQIHNLFVQAGDATRHPPVAGHHPNGRRDYDKLHFVNANSLMSLERAEGILPGATEAIYVNNSGRLSR